MVKQISRRDDLCTTHLFPTSFKVLFHRGESNMKKCARKNIFAGIFPDMNWIWTTFEEKKKWKKDNVLIYNLPVTPEPSLI